MSELSDLRESLKEAVGEDCFVRIKRIMSQTIDITVVSDRFNGLDTKEREEIIWGWQQSGARGLDIEFMSLFTYEEADALDIDLSSEEPERNVVTEMPTTWLSLIGLGHKEQKVHQTESDAKEKVVAFYSYKGGVGRTTALVHAAWDLAVKKGKKVVIVDLDFEAPSIQQAVGRLKNEPSCGLVDYLFERVNKLDDESSKIAIADIIGEVDGTNGSLFVVPAGRMNEDYIMRVDVLRKLPVYDEQLWENFRSEIVDQLQPDLILVDSRTGINMWGALSLLRIADDAIFFMNPNPQNREGIATILRSLRKVGLKMPHVVVSPFVNVLEGRERAEIQWRQVQELVQEKDREGTNFAKPIFIPYIADVALAESYPHVSSLHHYRGIVQMLEDKLDRQRIAEVLAKYKKKRNMVSSLGGRDIGGAQGFQKTAAMEQFAKPSTILLTGRRGTGKSTLYATARDAAYRFTSGMIEEIIPIAAYGDTRPSITGSIQAIHEQLIEHGLTWEDYWRSHALVRVVQRLEMPWTGGEELKPLQEAFSQFTEMEREDSEVRLVLHLTVNDHLRALMERCLRVVESELPLEERQVWLLYDQLEELADDLSLRQDVIVGLLLFALSLGETRSSMIRPKIFLRTDTWRNLEFTEKKIFRGKEIELKWSWEDLLRLAVRRATIGGDVKTILTKYLSLGDIDSAPREVLEDAMEFVWGVERGGRHSEKVSEWLKRSLTDANGAGIPSSIVTLLETAFEVEHRVEESEVTDRMLSSRAVQEGLQAGLGEVATCWCEAIRLEHPDLEKQGFFDFLSEIPSIFSGGVLLDWLTGEKGNIPKLGETLDLLKRLQAAGMITLIDSREGHTFSGIWRVASIYAHGFQMKEPDLDYGL